MPRSPKLLRLLLLVLIPFALVDQNAHSDDTLITLTPDERIVSGELSNGLKYAVMQSNTPVGETFLRFYVNVGSLDEAEGEEGVAHFLEHMAFNGSKNIPEDELVPMLQRLGLAFGVDANASTSYDRTLYTLRLPTPDEELLDTGLMLFREIASNLTLAQSAIDRERGVINAERRVRKGPQQKAAVERLEFFMKGTKLPDRLPIGLEASTDAVSADQMRAFYHRFYRPDNAYLVVTSDQDPAVLLDKIKAWFADWQPVGEEGPKRTYGTFDLSGQSVGGIFEPGLSTLVSIHGVKDGAERLDTYETREQEVLLQLANGIINRRLGTITRRAESDILGAGTSRERVFNFAEIATIQAASKPDNWEAALKLIMIELRKALTFGFDPTEIEEVLKITRVSLTHAVDNQDNRSGAALANWLVAWHASKSVPTSPETNLAIFEAVALKATPDALLDALRQAWSSTTPRYFIQSASLPDDVETRYNAVLAEAQAAPIKANDALEERSFAYTDFGETGQIAEQRFDDRLNAHMVRFANNVRLTIRPTNWKKETISATVRFGEGTHSLTKDMPGFGEVIAPAFIGGGLGQHSLEDLTRIFVGRTVGLGFDPQFEDFVFSGTFRPEDLVAQFQLWAAYTVDPAYRTEGLVRYRRTLDTRYQNLDITPGQVLGNQGTAHLAPGDPRYGMPPRDKVERYREDQVRGFLAPSLASGEIEIAVVGSVDVSEIIDAVANTFGALPTRTLQDQPDASHWDTPFPTPQEKVFYHKGEVDQSLLRYVWPTHDDGDRQRNIIAFLTSRILADQLRERVREDLSASYSPSASSAPSLDYIPRPGTFSLGMELNPDDVPAVRSIIEEILEKLMAEGGVTADALDRARKPVIADLIADDGDGDANGEPQKADDKKSNGYWLGLIAQAQSRPDRVLLTGERLPLYERVTPQDITAYIQRWLILDKAIIQRVLHESMKPISG